MPRAREEQRIFDRVRRRFVEAAAEHMDRGKGIDAIVRDPDSYLWSFLETIVAAARDGKPVPAHLQWFFDFCVSAPATAFSPDSFSASPREKRPRMRCGWRLRAVLPPSGLPEQPRFGGRRLKRSTVRSGIGNELLACSS